MKIINWLKSIANKIPLWVVNICTILSCVVAMFPVGISVYNFFKSRMDGSVVQGKFYLYAMCALIVVVFVLLLQIKKYRTASLNRLEITSKNYHKLTHECRDLYFDILSKHKNGEESIGLLTDVYKNRLALILDNLSKLLQGYTGKEICCCIKLIKYQEPEERIDLASQTLTTLCRSTNSDTNRGQYETAGIEIKLSDNTDYLDIVDLVHGSGKNYFYQPDLEDFDKKLRKEHAPQYRNTNPRWASYYKSVIVVPIQIEFKRLYSQQTDDAYHVIGFLCADSLSANAFTKGQEKFNVDTMRSYADLLYILLGQYKHYLKKLKNMNMNHN